MLSFIRSCLVSSHSSRKVTKTAMESDSRVDFSCAPQAVPLESVLMLKVGQANLVTPHPGAASFSPRIPAPLQHSRHRLVFIYQGMVFLRAAWLHHVQGEKNSLLDHGVLCSSPRRQPGQPSSGVAQHMAALFPCPLGSLELIPPFHRGACR